MFLAFFVLFLAITLEAQTTPEPKKTVWNGVFTDAQAVRGQKEFEKNCMRCHEGDTAEDDWAARFRGMGFMERWREYDVDALFTFIKLTMPRRQPKSLPDQTYLDIVASMLQANHFPAGSRELKLEELKDIQIEGRDGPKPLSGGALVQIVGCFAKDEKDWMITNATEPARTSISTGSTSRELETAHAKALGDQTYRLQNIDFLASTFMPETHVGNKLQTKGKLIRQPNRDRIDITWVDVLAETCGK